LITLEGEVEWHYQREREAVARVRGVLGVVNYIEVRPQVPPVEIKRKIEEALSAHKRSTRVGRAADRLSRP
jgi:osmotically-inducible protein OsmY